MSIRPIFIFSAPRSGSTLLQRVLAAHADVATASEPWILLPMLAPLRPDLSTVGGLGSLVRNAVEDFVRALPDGRADYLAGVRAAALRLYADAAGRDEGWFVDKSPIYHLVADEVVEAFPDGRFIFLWRHPLSVVASAVELFYGGRWEVNRGTMAFFRSVEDLVAASRRHAAVSHAVRFEDVVSGDEATWRTLLEYVGIEYDPRSLEGFADVRLEGALGDPTGTRLYTRLDRAPISKWRRTVDNPVRKMWCRRYLLWVGRERLSHMGYDLDEILAELDAIDSTLDGTLSDVSRLGASAVRDAVKLIVPAHAGGPSVWPQLVGRHRPAGG